MAYNPNNEAKGKIGEALVEYTFTSHGYFVKPHDVSARGCDGIFWGNGVTLGDYEVNYWQSNTYFSDERIISVDSNLYNGLEWVNDGYVKHGDRIQYRFHFSFGAARSEAQIDDAKELGIIYIHTKTLPTSDELWAIVSPFLEGNPNLKFFKINVIGNNHLRNDRTSMMVLLTPIISNLISKIQGIISRISSKIRILGFKIRLRDCLFKVKSSVKAILSISNSNLKGKTSLAFNVLREKLSDAKVHLPRTGMNARGYLSGVIALQRYIQR